MARRIIDASGSVWEVSPTGRRTQYGSDEVSLEFAKVSGGEPEVRVVRYAPRGAKAVEMALEEASDRALLELLVTTQPAWSSPDTDYGRPV